MKLLAIAVALVENKSMGYKDRAKASVESVRLKVTAKALIESDRAFSCYFYLPRVLHSA